MCVLLYCRKHKTKSCWKPKPNKAFCQKPNRKKPCFLPLIKKGRAVVHVSLTMWARARVYATAGVHLVKRMRSIPTSPSGIPAE